MNINVRSRKNDVTPAMRDYAEKRLAKFDKMMGGVDEVSVLHNVVKDTHVVEVTINVDGLLLRSEVNGNDMYSCIDLAVEKLERQVRKHKTRLEKRFRKDAQRNSMKEIEPLPNDEKLVKNKRFDKKPLSVDEAIMQMELLGHSFFAFVNDETGETNVVYKRKDDNYGLLQPE
ncbi:MAG: ribosome-associated translation inhibitor RaiA [Firmicutes bacterium]|nr:ribosome-associated translation inhibitor RaiA [Bacillota bacterium]MBQ3199313.1 ribosome-associated translation inhibitor RaiA [Bacillota bacterium]